MLELDFFESVPDMIKKKSLAKKFRGPSEKVKTPINLKKQIWDPQKPQLNFDKKLYTSALKISRDIKKFHQSKVVPKPFI